MMVVAVSKLVQVVYGVIAATCGHVICCANAGPFRVISRLVAGRRQAVRLEVGLSLVVGCLALFLLLLLPMKKLLLLQLLLLGA